MSEELLMPDEPSQHVFHSALAAFNRRRLTPQVSNDSWDEELVEETRWRRAEEGFIRAQRLAVSMEASAAPKDADAFVAWFETLEMTGPGQHHPLFAWLANEATREQMTWFLTQEVAGEAGFEDLVALTQVKLQSRAKLELARNYWDEMGQGHAGGMHGPMLEALARELSIDPDVGVIASESLALGNLMTALACNRRYTYQSLGALGVVELTAPGRASAVNAGLKRLGVRGESRRYFALHATLDVKHSAAWNAEVLRPLLESSADVGRAIAEGALMRLHAGARCFRRYTSELRSLGATFADERHTALAS